MRLARHVVAGRVAWAEGALNRAVTEFRSAVEIQDSLAYLEPPFCYNTKRQTLGAALIAAGKPAEAEAVFEASLAKVKDNGWALFGLMEAQKALGKTAVAAATEKRFRQAWHGKSDALDLARM